MSSKTPTGQIAASDLRSVFGETGANGRVDLGNFRVTHNVDEMTNMPLDEGVPQSGQITFNDLRGKRLNIIVRYGNEARPNTGKERYNGGGSNVVVLRPSGSSIGRPSSSAGCRVTLHVRGQVTTSGSERNQRYRCALRTGGAWESDTRLEVNVGGEGEIVGGGGDGGNGSSNEDVQGDGGRDGSSGLGVAYTLYKLTVQSGGEIRAGGGGGGGGGTGREDSARNDRKGGGGGGGGGAGVPAGRGGLRAELEGFNEAGGRGENGEGGSSRQGGRGGNGGENDSESFGGGGGGGGAPGAEDGEGGEGGEEGTAEDGTSGNTSNGEGGRGGSGKGREGGSAGGSGGEGGFAYVIKSGQTIERFSGSGRIDGDTTSGYTGSI